MSHSAAKASILGDCAKTTSAMAKPTREGEGPRNDGRRVQKEGRGCPCL